MPQAPNPVPDAPVIERGAVWTKDVDQGSAVVSRLYADLTFDIDRPDTEFELKLNSASVGPLSSMVARYGFGGRVESSPVEAFTTAAVHEGAMAFSPDHTVRNGGVWRSDNHGVLRARWAAGSLFTVLGLPMDLLTEVAQEQSTLAETASLAFDGNVPMDDAAGRYWVELMRFADRQLNLPQSPLESPLIRADFARMLAGTALTTFPNSTMTIDHRIRPGVVGPATTRRATTYIHAHAHEPIRVADIAAAAGIGVRAVQEAFVKHHECSPMTYLRRVRLERAHRDLLAADPSHGDTVRAIAMRWGHGHLGRFAAEYARTYGATPSQSLRR